MTKLVAKKHGDYVSIPMSLFYYDSEGNMIAKDGKSYTQSATNGEDVVINGSDLSPKRNVNGKYSPTSKSSYGTNLEFPLFAIWNTINELTKDKNPFLQTGTPPTVGFNPQTTNFYKWLGKDINTLKKIGWMTEPLKFSKAQKFLLKLLEDNGVDTKFITPLLLDKAKGLRLNEIRKTAPSDYNLHTTLEYAGDNSQVIYGNKDSKTIGKIDLFKSPKYFSVGYVENTSGGTAKGVQERLTNAAIDVAKQQNLKGVISGERLLSPEKTQKMYSKYKDKEIIGHDGEWQWGRINGDMLTTFDNPIYLLKSETYHIPTKSTYFNPIIIDENGLMHIDWNNRDIFKSLIPLVGGSYVYLRDSKIL